MTRTKVKFQLDKNHLDLISSVFNWIITTNQAENASKLEKV